MEPLGRSSGRLPNWHWRAAPRSPNRRGAVRISRATPGSEEALGDPPASPETTMFHSALLVGSLLHHGGIPPSQQDFSKVEVKASHVAGAVHMLTGAGGNIGVSVGPDGILIVDDQFAPLAEKIRAALKTLGEGKLRFVLNTHWHGDHTGGNVAFGPEAPVLAHTNVRKRLEEGSEKPRPTPPAPKEALPIITFDESLSVHFNGEEIKVLHYPHGHTDGDSVIFFTKSNVVHLGDDFFAGRFPFVDLERGGGAEGRGRHVPEPVARH